MEPWPLRHLVLRSPRLELRPDDDAGLHELAAEAELGIHDSGQMPFSVAWTDEPVADLGGNMLRYHWETRARCRPDDWRINFLVRLDGRVIGTQGLSGKDFTVTKEVDTGSWLGIRHQGNGYGTEMRAAVLLFAFDHLGAGHARSDAFTDNAASLAVSRKLGYLEDGVNRMARRGKLAENMRLLLTVNRFGNFRPPWPVEVDGLDNCRSLLVPA